ncbi:hypothetical protein LTR16_011284, partial [Cryomyces antarcticus]
HPYGAPSSPPRLLRQLQTSSLSIRPPDHPPRHPALLRAAQSSSCRLSRHNSARAFCRPRHRRNRPHRRGYLAAGHLRGRRLRASDRD